MYFRNKISSFRRNKQFCSEEDDVGIVYTRDKYGRLQTPEGYALKLGDKNHLKDFEPRAASCSIQDQNGKTSPCSLYFITLDFVAKNITMVESLCGFPEIVGKDLFDRVQIQNNIHSWKETLPLFIDAYENLVLDKLSLKEEYLAVNELDHLKCFMHLSELDLSGCKLGNYHELLQHLSKLSSLTRLSLKDNCLHDGDVKMFTLPLRVMKVGPVSLSLLDLSCNPGITNASLRYLTALKSLAGLNLSGTGVTCNSDDVAKFMRVTGMASNPQFSRFSDQNQIQTEGWVTCVIEDWLTSLKSVKKQPKQPTDNKVKSFYTQMIRPSILQETNIRGTKSKRTETSVLILTKSNHLKSDFQIKSKDSQSEMNEKGKNEWENETELNHEIKQVENSMCNNKNKNAFGMPRSNYTARNNKHATDVERERMNFKYKRKQQSSDDGDSDMMKLYMKSTAVTEHKKRKLSLADLE